ncbi:MAG TPA: hypothetical protein VFO86_03355 [Terriglobia bacterium]|nr:hypothetical protein [Terriglobia bacterium]
MNCSEASALFGEALDGSMQAGARKSLLEHLGLCRGCRRSYELESITKAVVGKRCAHATTPPEIVQSIVASLHQASESPFFAWVQDVFTMRRVLPTLAGAVALVAVLVLVRTPSTTVEHDEHTASNDVIFQSLQNFDRLRNGELKPAVVAANAEDIHQYLDHNGMDFAVVQPLDCCTSYGALTSEYNGVRLAQVVYTMNQDVMYVYQVRKKNVFDGSALIISPAARMALEKTGWYTDPHHPSGNVILWLKNETLCAAVSSMKKDEMLALLNRN